MGLFGLRTSTRVCALLLVLGGLIGCDCFLAGVPHCSDAFFSLARGKINFGQYVALIFGKTRKGGPPKQTYVAFTATKDGAGGTIRPPREVYGPFRLECLLGSFDAKRANWGEGTVGVSVQDPFGLGQAFHAIQLRRDGDGVAARASAQGGVTFDEVTFAGTTVLQLAMERTSGEVIYEARRPGDVAFTEIGRIASSYSGAYRTSWDIADLKRKAVVGIDSLEAVSLGDGPAPSDARGTARAASLEAGRLLLRAARLLDGSGSDVDGGRTAVEEADAAVAAAQAQLASIPGNVTALTKQFATARKQLAKATKKLDQGKPSAKTLGALKSAARQLARAADTLSN